MHCLVIDKEHVYEQILLLEQIDTMNCTVYIPGIKEIYIKKAHQVGLIKTHYYENSPSKFIKVEMIKNNGILTIYGTLEPKCIWYNYTNIIVIKH